MNIRIKIAAILLLFAVALSSIGPLVRSANAYNGSGSGRPGKVTIYRVNGTLYNNISPQLYDGGTIVYRSPASTGSQILLNYYEIWRWNGSAWVKFYTTPATRKTIVVGVNSARSPALNVLPSRNANYYYVIQKIQWSSSSGISLGQYTVNMNQSGDYYCASVIPTKCSVGAGYIHLIPGP